MPIYMDVHIVPGVSPKDVAEAHTKDVLLQEEHACKCMTYWIDETRSSVFCLIEAPSKDAVIALHSKAHGLVPHKIVEVSSAVVESFLGRIYDPEDATIVDGLKVFHDPSFRILLLTKVNDSSLLKFTLGKEKAMDLLNRYNTLVRKHLSVFGGREAEHESNGFVATFSSATKAVATARAIQQEVAGDEEMNLLLSRISIVAGEPITNSSSLFGEAIHLGRLLCSITKQGSITISWPVKQLLEKEYDQDDKDYFIIEPQDEEWLKQLYSTFDKHSPDPAFNVEDYCRVMAISQSQFYRKTISLTGLSPILLLKEYRLEKARELMKKKCHNVSQVTFDTGFTSASYFTKCFKKKYGLLPMNYMELV
jgi:AraC-like DNA-binding protein